ncbi:MAG: aldo/keto reductase [Sutterellaceae bacterium]|nr:aldo/keto reductase [Sutterellaceae bacterium]MDD7442328.1 aldo/keto reductase [Sutterellaceae bacterium]MDY2868380.1 aldo/keto reductase [Mesosutterella sp.]
MEYTLLGHSGIRVSKLCVGCMSFGEAGSMHDWTLDLGATSAMVKRALDLGINFFDTANCYSKGTSEEYLGEALRRSGVKRQDVVIASKVYFNPGRLSRDAIRREVEGSLKRLGTDYLDLYIIHRFDYGTSILETMEVLNELVREGKVRSLGASAMYGYQFQDMQLVARDNGWMPFTAMENHYNLLYREDEREMIPICREMSVALMPYSPLAAGRLARLEWADGTKRGETDVKAKEKYDSTREIDYPIVRRVAEVAGRHGVSMARVALAWLWAKGVASPIVGATSIPQLEDACGALDVKLTPDEIAYLEELYRPHAVVGALRENPPEEKA